MEDFPPRSEVNAIRLPSGDQAGSKSPSRLEVIWISLPRIAFPAASTLMM